MNKIIQVDKVLLKHVLIIISWNIFSQGKNLNVGINDNVCVGGGGAKSLQSCLTLCNPMDCSVPGYSVYGILQARILEWVVMPSSGDLPDPGVKPPPPMSLALAGSYFTTGVT